MPAFASSPSRWRSTIKEFEEIVSELTDEGVEIPFHACGAYRQVRLYKYKFLLFAITWPFLSQENFPVRTLMLILSAKYGNILPPGLRLRISDTTGILVQRKLGPNSKDSYLYVQIAGRWDEQFTATVSARNSESRETLSLSLPSFIYPIAE